MGAYKIVYRGVQFSAEGDAITRSDLTSEETQEDVIAGSGKPVPIIFGTRYIEPTVVGFHAVAGNTAQYYRASRPSVITPSYDPDIDDYVRMIVLSLRMVLCAGYIDGIGEWLVGSVPFIPLSPITTNPSKSNYEYARQEISNTDANMFGVGLDGGLGYPLRSSSSYLRTDAYSEFWLFKGGDYQRATSTEQLIADSRIDLGSEARGLTSLYFDGFNFGGKLPPEKWRLQVTRIFHRTQRVDGKYLDQWDGGINDLAIIETAQFMNPVVAIREMLTDPDWGEGVAETQIDDGSFIVAARTCRDEGLKYCAAHDKLGGVDKIVKSATDYVDGILFYEAATDQVRLKLIREDYTFTNIPAFDETNISSLKNYQRQHGHELINSVTIKYHDALKGSNDTVTVHDLESSSRVKRVISATLNYDGCATKLAAVRVAERELTALSKAVISFTATVNATEVLGLGDAILVSWQDLDLARIVMRISKIDYGDGTTGGITLHLIQDVFANLATFDDLVGDEPLPDDTPTLINLQENVKFLEMSNVDVNSLSNPAGDPIILSPTGKYVKAGIKYDSTVTANTFVTIDGQRVRFSIGTLLDDIHPLTDDPRSAVRQGLLIYVYGVASRTRYIRVNDEIMQVTLTGTTISDNIYEYQITRRAIDDTVSPPTKHPAGSDVWFLDDMWKYADNWDGVTPFVSLVQQGVYLDRELVTPNINFINRHTLPYPPSFVTVNGSYRARARVDGDINIVWGHRISYQGQTASVRLMNGDQQILLHQFNEPTQAFTIRSDIINLTGEHELVLYVGSSFNRLNSWQSWVFNIDWSSTIRQRTGWSYNWGNDWGGDDASGWGFDWNKFWGN